LFPYLIFHFWLEYQYLNNLIPYVFLYTSANIKINKQKNNSRQVSKISIKSLLINIAYNVYARLLVTHNIQDLILKSSDFFVFISLIVCGKYDIKVQKDTIPNKIFPNILYTSL